MQKILYIYKGTNDLNATAYIELKEEDVISTI